MQAKHNVGYNSIVQGILTARRVEGVILIDVLYLVWNYHEVSVVGKITCRNKSRFEIL